MTVVCSPANSWRRFLAGKKTSASHRPTCRTFAGRWSGKSHTTSLGRSHSARLPRPPYHSSCTLHILGFLVLFDSRLGFARLALYLIRAHRIVSSAVMASLSPHSGAALFSSSAVFPVCKMCARAKGEECHLRNHHTTMKNQKTTRRKIMYLNQRHPCLEAILFMRRNVPLRMPEVSEKASF